MPAASVFHVHHAENITYCCYNHGFASGVSYVVERSVPCSRLFPIWI